MRDGVTVQRRLSLVGYRPRISLYWPALCFIELGTGISNAYPLVMHEKQYIYVCISYGDELAYLTFSWTNNIVTLVTYKRNCLSYKAVCINMHNLIDISHICDNSHVLLTLFVFFCVFFPERICFKTLQHTLDWRNCLIITVISYNERDGVSNYQLYHC